MVWDTCGQQMFGAEADLAQQLDFLTVVGCAAHDVQGAVHWSTKLFLSADDLKGLILRFRA